MSIDSSTRQTLLQLATFKLRHIIRHTLRSLRNQEETFTKNTLFIEMITKSIKKDNEVTEIITLLYKLELCSIQTLHPQFQDVQIRRVCRQSTKQFINQLIREEANNLNRIADRQTKEQIEQSLAHLPNVAINIAEQGGKRHSINLALIPVISLAFDVKKIKPLTQQKQVQCESFRYQPSTVKLQPLSIQVQNQIQDYSYVHHLTKKQSFIESQAHQHIKQQIVFNIIDQSEEEDVMVQSEKHGHFLYGDTIQTISDVFIIDGQMMLVINWKEREEGDRPKSSNLSAECVKQHHSLALAQFYQYFIARVQQQSWLIKIQ